MPWPRPTGSEIIGHFSNVHAMECDVLVLRCPFVGLHFFWCMRHAPPMHRMGEGPSSPLAALIRARAPNGAKPYCSCYVFYYCFFFTIIICLLTARGAIFVGVAMYDF